MKNCYMISIVLGILIISCTPKNSVENQPTLTDRKVSPTEELLTIQKGGYELSIIIPKALIKEDSRLSYRSNFGDLELYIDPKFHLYITEEELSLQALKEELQQDELFSRKFYNEGRDELLYQSILPDGSEMGYQWISQITFNDRSFIVKTDPQGDYSRQQIRKIQECSKSIQLF
ncbi:MAG: hypothetical protein AB8B53_02385 [Flavobacteriales bacterium]